MPLTRVVCCYPQMAFRVIFNSVNPAWEINDQNPVWIVVRWTLWRAQVVEQYGYNTYIILLYVQAAAVLVAVLGLVWLTLAMRKAEQSKWLRYAALALHVLFDVMFQVRGTVHRFLIKGCRSMGPWRFVRLAVYFRCAGVNGCRSMLLQQGGRAPLEPTTCWLILHPNCNSNAPYCYWCLCGDTVSGGMPHSVLEDRSTCMQRAQLHNSG